MTSGIIYKITNKINDKVYIGQTTNLLSNRIQQHENEAFRQHKYSNRKLYRAIREYGIKNFEITEIEKIPKEELDEREKFWINYYNSYYNGYNGTTGGRANKSSPKKTYQFDLKGNLLQEFSSTIEAAKWLLKTEQVKNSLLKSIYTNIREAAVGNNKTAYKYLWSYIPTITPIWHKAWTKEEINYFYSYYPNINSVAKALQISKDTVQRKLTNSPQGRGTNIIIMKNKQKEKVFQSYNQAAFYVKENFNIKIHQNNISLKIKNAIKEKEEYLNYRWELRTEKDLLQEVNRIKQKGVR